MKWLVALILSSVIPLLAAFNQMPPLPSLVATGLGGVASTQMRHAFLLNPALVAVNPSFSAGLYYSNWFSLRELQTSGLVARLPIHSWAVGGHLNTFGYSLYRETFLQLAVARQWADGRMAAGLAAQWYHLGIRNYGTQMALGVQLGIWYRVSSLVSLGGVVTNINEPRLSGSLEEIPYRMTAGIAIHPLPQGEIVAAVSKTSREPVEYRIGVRYRASQYLGIFTGFTSTGPQPAGGVALRMGQWELQYTLQYHFVLGATHLFSVAVIRGKAQ